MQRHDQFEFENFRMLRVQSPRSWLYQAMVGMEPSSEMVRNNLGICYERDSAYFPLLM